MPLSIRPVPGVLLALWCALVWYLSDQSDPSDIISLGFELPDWAAHFIEYAAGGVLAALALRAREPVQDALLALGFCALHPA